MSLLRLIELASPELQTVAQDGAVGLVPIGSLEQHGPHLPLGTDTLIAESLASMVADRLMEPVIVTPVIQVSLSEHHLRFPGTVSIGDDALAVYLTAYIESFSKAGVTDIALITSHGGNFAFLRRFVETTSTFERAPRVIAYHDLEAYVEVMLTGAETHGLHPPKSDIHAGGLETSQALHLFPELVRPYENVVGYTKAEPGWLEDVFENGVGSISSTGVLGDPAPASQQVGEAVQNALADELAGWMCRELGVHRVNGTD